ncbi:MAG: C10 family peptidase [Campylobacterota bacterium]|nr:C10 family peptidase [Campylobacterota bacterium]
MTKKNLITILLACMPFTVAISAERSYSDIKNVALNWAKMHQTKINYSIDKSSESTSMLYSQLKNETQNKAYHIVKLKPKGWVIVSGDDIVKPIIGYSLSSDISVNDTLPTNLVHWLKGVEKKINEAKNSGLDNSYYKNKWNKLTVDSKMLAVSSSEKQEQEPLEAIVQKGPLLSTTWNQGEYYNALCPADASASTSNGRTYVGCVATAMAQIMKYHAWPTTGQGDHSYIHDTYGELSADFTTTYNWSSMPNNVTSANNEVAKISYHSGVSVNMDYGPYGSGAYSSAAEGALINYFKYKTAGLVSATDKTATQWHNLLKADLDNGLPVYYDGSSSGSGGHAFICDGYKYEDDLKNYHFNWGWGGYADGWFAIGALNPEGNDFNDDNNAIFGITPDKRESTVVLDISESVQEGEFKDYSVSAKNEDQVNVLLSNLSADIDLYVRIGSNPTESEYDCRPWLSGTQDESCSITLNGDDNVHIGVHGYESGSYNLKATILRDATHTSITPIVLYLLQ